MYSRGPVRQVFPQRAIDELDWSYEKNGGQFNYFFDDEESKWLMKIDLIDKSNEGKQLDDRFPAPIPFRFAYFHHAWNVFLQGGVIIVQELSYTVVDKSRSVPDVVLAVEIHVISVNSIA